MKYSKQINNLFDRLDRHDSFDRKYITLKSNIYFRAEWEGDTIRLFHYGTYIGGVRLGERNTAILGNAMSVGDRLALNTMWKHYQCGRRVFLRKGRTVVESINECTDNVMI